MEFSPFRTHSTTVTHVTLVVESYEVNESAVEYMNVLYVYSCHQLPAKAIANENLSGKAARVSLLHSVTRQP